MALTFDGSSYLSLDMSGTGPVSSYPFTLAAWFKPPEEHKDWQGFVLSDGTETARYGMGPGNYGRWSIYCLSFEQRTAGGFSENYSSSSPNAWAQATCIFNASGDRKLYVNGSGNEYSNGSNIGATTLTDADIIGLGFGPTAGSNALYKGGMAECGLWNAALTTAEIDSLAAGFSPLFIQPDKLIGYWPLGGTFTAATSGADITGARNLATTGTLTEVAHPYSVWPTAHQNIIYPLAPAAIIPGQGHDYALPGNLLDYANSSQSDYTTPRQAADYGVPDGT